MAKIYYELIQKGLRTIGQVPVRIRAEVQALLDAEVSSASGTGTTAESGVN